MNFIILIILSCKNFEQKFYDTVRVATFFDLILCIFEATHIYMNCITCDKRKYNTYLMQFYQWRIAIFPTRMFVIYSMSSAFANINLIANRYFTAINKNNKYTKMSKKSLISIFFLISFIYYLISSFFVIEIYQINANIFSWRLSEFGKKGITKVYFLSIFLSDTIAPCVILSVLTILLIKKFNDIYKTKIILIPHQRQFLKKKERMFTKMILITTIIYLINRLIDMIAGVTTRLNAFQVIEPSFKNQTIINFIKTVSLLINFAVSSLNGLIYFQFDSRFREALFKRS